MASIQDLANAIANMEGINKIGSLAQRNNNPGNLRYVGQAGAVLGENGFAKFDSLDAGYQALYGQINLDSGRGLTLSQFINKYAPNSENDTNNYLNYLSNQTGIAPGETLQAGFLRG